MRRTALHTLETTKKEDEEEQARRERKGRGRRCWESQGGDSLLSPPVLRGRSPPHLPTGFMTWDPISLLLELPHPLIRSSVGIRRWGTESEVTPSIPRHSSSPAPAPNWAPDLFSPSAKLQLNRCCSVPSRGWKSTFLSFPIDVRCGCSWAMANIVSFLSISSMSSSTPGHRHVYVG